MKGSLKITFLLAAFGAAAVLAGCSSGGSSSSTPAAVTDTTVTGSVVQGPVVGAKVIADLLPANYTLDSDETYTFTDDNGDFKDLVIPAVYGDYVLVSLGGVDTISGEPALPMLAPAGAKNITPLTTLVALTPAADRDALIADLNTLAGEGNSYDSDPSVGAATDFVVLTQVVEETLVFMADLGVTETADQFIVASAIAAQLIADDAIGSGSVATSVADAVVASAPALAASATTEFSIVNATAFITVVADVVAAVEDAVIAAAVGGVVTETPDLTESIAVAADKVVDDADVTLQAAVTSISLGVDTVELLNDFDEVVSAEVPTGVTVTAAAATQIKFVLDAFNNTGAVKDYTDVSLSLSIVDQDSQRTATFLLTAAAVSVAKNVDGSADMTVNLDSATLTVVAADSVGNSITTSAVSGPFQIFTITNNEVLLNLADVQDLFADQVAADFATISLTGNYMLTLNAEGAPIVSEAIALTVN